MTRAKIAVGIGVNSSMGRALYRQFHARSFQVIANCLQRVAALCATVVPGTDLTDEAAIVLPASRGKGSLRSLVHSARPSDHQTSGHRLLFQPIYKHSKPAGSAASDGSIAAQDCARCPGCILLQMHGMPARRFQRRLQQLADDQISADLGYGASGP